MYRPFTGLNQHMRKRSFLVAAFHPVFPLRTLTDRKVFEVRVLQHYEAVGPALARALDEAFSSKHSISTAIGDTEGITGVNLG
jgi:hypothetical protein